MQETNSDDGKLNFVYNDSSAGFTTVLGRGNARKKKRQQRKWGTGQSSPPTPIEAVQKTMQEMRTASDWSQSCSKVFEKALVNFPHGVAQVLCLGLGSLHTSHHARFQLCYLLDLKEKFLPATAGVSAYDPVFTAEDKTVLQHFGIQILTENKQGKYALDGPTLAFMPHCDLELYENILRANWERSLLPNLLLIGNDLARYSDSTPTRILQRKYPCVHRLAPLATVELLPEHELFPNTFSCTAVQFVPPEVVEQQGEGFWELPEETEELRSGERTEGPEEFPLEV